MTDIIILKPRRNNSPHRFNGTEYPQIVDDLGVVHIHVEDPEYIAYAKQHPDTYEVPQEETSNEPVPAEAPVVVAEAAVDEPVVVAEAAVDEPVAVVAAGEEPVAPGALKAGKRKSRLS